MLAPLGTVLDNVRLPTIVLTISVYQQLLTMSAYKKTNKQTNKTLLTMSANQQLLATSFYQQQPLAMQVYALDNISLLTRALDNISLDKHTWSDIVNCTW